MSENLDLVRSICAAWERGDYTPVAWAHPEIEWVMADGPSPGRWTGVAGMAAGWRDFLSVWEEHRIEEVEVCRQIDDERVLVILHVSGRARTSGMEIGQIGTRTAGLFHIRDGKVTRLAVYFDRGRALADLGLEE